ncbi:hypothetical protein JQ543_06855 [Bradyrhizobium diazoefficiens]|nr:hypothetical protein [Bradyrhizobium diazoefficiens]MBR0773579.1 hypothetical protein [Bradyrhizobium diazoefficiens]MBR0847454.1 hypothetical protein [Bradyrhizobium diazoefficiens]
MPKKFDIQQNHTLDSNATNPATGDAWFGTGNPVTGWQVLDTGHIEIGANIHYRTGDQIQPSSVASDGSLIFHGPAGPQVVDPAHNVSSANPNRAAVSFDWSFDLGANGNGGQTQQQALTHGWTEQVKIDLDPGAGFKYLTLNAVYDPVHNPGGSHVVWEAADNTFAAQGINQGQIVVADDAGNAFATQNSTNLAFFNSLIDHDPNTPGVQGGGVAPAGTYDFVETVLNPGGNVMAEIHSTIILA